MDWNIIPDVFPKDGQSVMLKVHVTSMGNFVDKEKTLPAVYKDGKWLIDGGELVENNYPIMNDPVAWAEFS